MKNIKLIWVLIAVFATMLFIGCGKTDGDEQPNGTNIGDVTLKINDFNEVTEFISETVNYKGSIRFTLGGYDITMKQYEDWKYDFLGLTLNSNEAKNGYKVYVKNDFIDDGYFIIKLVN